MHYGRWKRHGDPLAKPYSKSGWVDPGCTHAGCDRVHYAKGLCKKHYRVQPHRLEKERDYQSRPDVQARRALNDHKRNTDPNRAAYRQAWTDEHKDWGAWWERRRYREDRRELKAWQERRDRHERRIRGIRCRPRLVAWLNAMFQMHATIVEVRRP